MTPEAQRSAIAEACGWTELHYHDDPKLVSKSLCGHPPGLDGKPSPGTTRNDVYVPDYLNDLNAMHEAENALPDRLMNLTYVEELSAVCGIDEGGEWTTTEDWQLLHATARQRAEAFLRCLGKWQDKTWTQSTQT